MLFKSFFFSFKYCLYWFALPHWNSDPGNLIYFGSKNNYSTTCVINLCNAQHNIFSNGSCNCSSFKWKLGFFVTNSRSIPQKENNHTNCDKLSIIVWYLQPEYAYYMWTLANSITLRLILVDYVTHSTNHRNIIIHFCTCACKILMFFVFTPLCYLSRKNNLKIFMQQ